VRLLLKINPKQKTPQPIDPHKIQGFIYNLAKNTDFEKVHDRERYKYFCFSNIFPFEPGEPLKESRNYNLLISTPENNFLTFLQGRFRSGFIFDLGEYEFEVVNCKKVNPKVTPESKLKTSTPAVASIPKSLYDKYNIESDREYMYWNKDMPLNAFVDLTSKNSVRKYNEYNDKNLNEDLQLFRSYKFKRGALVNYKDADIAGSIWEFKPNPKQESLNILNFLLDAGIGEKNSAGFGFFNVVKN